jgi:hypothetical protein
VEGVCVAHASEENKGSVIRDEVINALFYIFREVV